MGGEKPRSEMVVVEGFEWVLDSDICSKSRTPRTSYERVGDDTLGLSQPICV